MSNNKFEELVFSGIQPTGNLHLGNYLGAIKNWIDIQDKYKSIFCIVDMHAITVPQNPEILYQNTLETAAIFMACGINPKKSTIFPQSAVSGHAELAWVLSCYTPLGWLNRMTQFKEKAGKRKDNASLGLYGYPVLMASDILLYKATHVPVGEDQKQHLELSREIANSFNHINSQEFFPEPEPLIQGEGTRVMSLRDGTKKMSKSDDSEYSRINLSDSAEEIEKKFKKAKSDSIEGISYDKDARPEASNLISIYAALSESSQGSVVTQYQNSGFGQFKKDLAELAVNKLSPITSEFNKLKQDKAFLEKTLREGAQVANEIAEKNIKQVKEIIGFFN